MPKHHDARAVLFERIRTSPPKFVHLVGVPYFVEAETAVDPDRLDHVWITAEAPPFGRLRLVVNTLSRLNRDAGFDSRVRLGILRDTYRERPSPGLEECAGLDYAKLESRKNVFYETHEREPLTELLVAKAKVAIRVEAWGDLYGRDHLGMHQIHSRRASCAVPLDLTHRDGALKFYYPQENVAETLLLKFCGQP